MLGTIVPKQFNSHLILKAIPAPLEAGTVVGHLTYEDNDLIGQGYITTERPSYEMIAEKKVEKAFFLKVWWNQFIRFINENYKKSRF